MSKVYNTSVECTPEVIAAWKAANPRGIWQLQVEHERIDTGETDNKGKAILEQTYKIGYVRKPTRDEMKFAMTLATQNDPLGMVEEILKSCWLGGDQELIGDDDYFYGAAMQLQELVEIKAGQLKKL